MYGRGQSSLTIAIVAFLAGCLFTTFFSVTPKVDSPLTPQRETVRR